MIAIDTNVLLRYLLQDDKTQSPKANRLINGNHKILVTDIVLSETIWTLKGKKYKLSKENILIVINQLFKEPNFTFEDGQTVWRASNTFRTTQPVKVGSKKKDVDFSDILILEKAKTQAAKTDDPFNGLFTFDTALLQCEGALKP